MSDANQPSSLPMAPILGVPENLQVIPEPIVPNECTFCPATCSHGTAICTDKWKRVNEQFYGLTLSWSAGMPSCNGALAGYNVYRSRMGGGAPIKITKQPVSVPALRVDYLPLIGPEVHGSSDKRIFGISSGPFGWYGGGVQDSDPDGLTYAVTTVDLYGNESAVSNGVHVHTSAQGQTLVCSGNCTQEDNYEWGAITIPGPSEVPDPNGASAFSWNWNYGRDPNSDVGPSAGNWVLAKWNTPSAGIVNDYRLLRKKAGESVFTEVPLDLIPGDDKGIRQFVWRMPLEMACEDANYAMRSVDLYGQPTDPNQGMSNVIGVAKYKLRPENPRATAASNQVTVTWDALPSCSGDLKGYSLYRSTASYDSCSGTDPNSITYEFRNNVTAPAASIGDSPGSPYAKRWWYRVKAHWYSWGNESDWSAPVCISADGQISEIAPEPSADEQYRLAATDDLPMLLEPSEHRVVGQSGGSDPAVKLSFYHVDHLGTPRVITDVAGNAITKHKYLPFGEELTPPPSTNTHEFTGHERDTETGLDYMLARYYGDASKMRFLSTDPLDVSAVPEFPQTWNRYTYADNNPLRYVDPDGQNPVILEEVVEATKAVATVVAEAGPSAARGAAAGGTAGSAAPGGGTVAGAVIGAIVGLGIGVLEGSTPTLESPAEGSRDFSGAQLSDPGGTTPKPTCEPPQPTAQAQHTKDARKSTEQKHQEGQTRGKRDARLGEKGDKQREAKGMYPRKPPPGHKGPWPPKKTDTGKSKKKEKQK
jgi:RHS repeat-associated protein